MKTQHLLEQPFDTSESLCHHRGDPSWRASPEANIESLGLRLPRLSNFFGIRVPGSLTRLRRRVMFGDGSRRNRCEAESEHEGEDQQMASQPPTDDTPASPPTDLSRERSWRFEKSSYDRQKFYVRSKDDSGHSEWQRLRIPPDVSDQAFHYIGKNSPFPYRSFSELARDALVHRLHDLTEMAKDDQAQLQFERILAASAIEERAATERHAREWIKSIRFEMDAVASDYIERGQPEIAVEKLQSWHDQIPDDGDEPQFVYIRGYIKAKIIEVGRIIRGETSS